MQIIPAVDVLDGRVVRLEQGRYDRVTAYGDDPVAAVRDWADQGADLVHVVDLAGARDGSPDPGLWRGLGQAGVPFQAGGGLRTVAAVVDAIAAGAERAVVGTAAVWSAGLVAEMIGRVGPGALVAAVDVGGTAARGAGWRDEGRPLEVVLGELDEAGIARVLVTAIARDGTMTGPDLSLLDSVRLALPGVKVIASGGVGSLDDVRALATAGYEAAIVGRALYEGRFTFPDAAEAAT